ncbi:MAG: hypothetical protein AB7J40_02090 [Candidatus Altimarinota bacterium]
MSEINRQREYFQRVVDWMDPGYFVFDPASKCLYRLKERHSGNGPERFGMSYVFDKVFGDEGGDMTVDSDWLVHGLMDDGWILKDGVQGKDFLAQLQVASLKPGQTIVNLKSGTRRAVAGICGETSFTLEVTGEGDRSGEQQAYRDYQIFRGLTNGIITIEER